MFLPPTTSSWAGTLTAVAVWANAYRRMASAHRDADGRPPQHTWFYPIEQFDAQAGSGRWTSSAEGDTGRSSSTCITRTTRAASLAGKFDAGKKELGRPGAFVTDEPHPRSVFAFAHGNMSLDNSRGDAYCGVNDEFTVLQQMGCFADFTFPSIERRCSRHW